MISFPGKLFKNHFHASMLMLLTLIGGGLRFAWIDRPAIWGDESATLGRVCGSYQDLLDRLQYDGFGPIHYEAYWWIANGFPYKFETRTEPVRLINFPMRRRSPQKEPTSQPTEKKWLYPTKSLTSPVMMTPFVMRFIPAVAGTLMIPAMYFLAVQLANRRVALIAATFTTFSAYLLVYSRDAKMYMHLWLACTLSVACMLWWFRCAKAEHGGQPGMRPYHLLAWLGWLASSISMVGIHATGAVVLGLEVVFLLTHLLPRFIFMVPRLIRRIESLRNVLSLGMRAVAGFAALAIAATGILVHHFHFAKFLERATEDFGESGIWWVAGYNQDRAGLDLVKFTASAFTLSWEWPTEAMIDNIPIRTYKAFTLACYGLLAIGVVAMFPWRKWKFSRRSKAPATEMSSSALTAERQDGNTISPTPYAATAHDPSLFHNRPSEGVLPVVTIFFLLCWLIVPAYAMYCRSIREFFSPTQIIGAAAAVVRDVGSPFSVTLKVVICAIPMVAFIWSFLTFASAKRWAIRLGLLISTVAILFVFCEIAYLVILAKYKEYLAAGKPWLSVWMPRYVGYLWPPFAILAAAMIARLPTRPVRGAVIAALVGVNLLNFAWRLRESEPPTDKIAADVLASQGQDANTRAYTQVRYGFGAPGDGGVPSIAWRYYMIVYGKVVASPLQMRMMGGGYDDSRVTVIQNVSPQYISNDVKRNPRLTRLIVWDKINSGWADVNTEDRLRKLLGPEWRSAGEQKFTSWEHWTWQELFTARRREYIRISQPGKPST